MFRAVFAWFILYMFLTYESKNDKSIILAHREWVTKTMCFPSYFSFISFIKASVLSFIWESVSPWGIFARCGSFLHILYNSGSSSIISFIILPSQVPKFISLKASVFSTSILNLFPIISAVW